MSDNHDLLNDKDVCSFEEHEAENVCSNKDAVACGDGSIDVKSTEVRTANGLEIKGFREFGVNIIGLLHALFFVSERTGLL